MRIMLTDLSHTLSSTGNMINVSYYSTSTCKGQPVYSELVSPTANCEGLTTLLQTSGYLAYSCGLAQVHTY